MPGITDMAGIAANPYAAIPEAALGLAQTVTGLVNAAKAKKEAKELAKTRPKRETDPRYGQTLSLAESELAGGMSTAAESAYNQISDRQQAGSLSALLRGGGDVNSVSELYAAGEEGRQRLAMLKDQLRLKQIDNVVKARETMSEEVDKNFLFNDFAPWADKAQANAQARASAEKQIWSGLDTFAGGLGNNAGGGGGGDNNGGVNAGFLNFAGEQPRTNQPNVGYTPNQPSVPFNPMVQPAYNNAGAMPPAYNFPWYQSSFYFGG